MSVSSSAPVHKLAFIVEESLRLCSLPGEDEGRAYYFRRLHVSDLPENGDRRVWFEAFQRALHAQASGAVHAGHPASARADAVYFRNEQEACELLLMAIVARRTTGVWFWPHVNGVPAEAAASIQATGVIERLIATQASWVAVSAAVFSTIQKTNSIALLSLLPVEVLNRWLREAGADRHARGSFAAVDFRESARRVILEAIKMFGQDSVPVLWLASLAVIAQSPSVAGEGTSVQIARASLKVMLASSLIESEKDTLQRIPEVLSSQKLESHAKTQDAAVDSPAIFNPESDDAAATTPPSFPQPSPSHSPSASSSPSSSPAPTREETCFGEPTSGAGLYFLLNALTRLKIQDEQFSLSFLARLFLRIGSHAEIESTDPILLWATTIKTQNESDAVPTSEERQLDNRLLRLWLLKIRRWCWRNGSITVREIVQRPGYVTLTRTDLDIALSIDSADIRIRRIGLDLDPGWLPWFGRVVRFHYRYRGESRG